MRVKGVYQQSPTYEKSRPPSVPTRVSLIFDIKELIDVNDNSNVSKILSK